MTVPLNCIDKGLLALHSGNEPMIEHCIVTGEGAVDPAKLKAALNAVLHRHPTWRSTIKAGLLRQVRHEKNAGGDDVLTVWDSPAQKNEPGTHPSEIDTWHTRHLSEWMNRPIDPFKELPCRVLLLEKTVRHFTLVFTCHHSAADGLHLFRFAGEVVREYNGGTGDPYASTCSDANGRVHGLTALARAHTSKVHHFHLRILASLVHRFLIAPFSPNARICPQASTRSAQFQFSTGSLNPHELRQIRSRSKAVGATLNDALLSACFRAVQQWNDVHHMPSRKISIMVPVDIGGATPSPVAGNQVSFISVSTTPRERNDPDQLLRTVSKKTSHMLENGIAFSIVYAASFCSLISPKVTRCVATFLMTTRIYLDSILLTNLGLVWPKGITVVEGSKLGDAKITSVVGIPPVVSPMGMSLCAGTYDDHLYFSLTYKTTQFSEAQAMAFLNLYLHELRGYQRTPDGFLPPEVTQRQTRVTATVR